MKDKVGAGLPGAPALDTLYRKYAGRGLAIIGFSVAEKRAVVEGFFGGKIVSAIDGGQGYADLYTLLQKAGLHLD